MTTVTTTSDGSVYHDNDLVYVDPSLRCVVDRVEWSRSGNPKSRAISSGDGSEAEGKERRRRRSHYPWGTYRSMKRIFKIEGKCVEERPTMSLDDALARALTEPYWN